MNIESNSTEERIMKATLLTLQREGVDKATTKKIAAEAGVNEVTIFRKFKNKKNLIEATKNHYIEVFIDRLNEIFDFNGDEEIGDYLKKDFNGLLNLSDDDFAIIKVAVEEVRDIPEKKLLISRITDTIINKLEEFFKLQIEKGEIRDINPKGIAILCFDIIFQSLVLFNVYSNPDYEITNYSDDFLDIIYNGIKV